MSELADELAYILEVLNPRFQNDASAAERYAKVLLDEAFENRYPVVRKVMAEALRWKP